MAGTELTLAFHKSLYMPAAIRAAAEAYGPYAEAIDVEDTEVETLVTLRGFDAGYGDMLGDAFGNHVLHETIVMARASLGGS